MSSEGQKSDTEPTNDKQPTQGTSSEKEGDQKKSETSDSATAAEKTAKTGAAKATGKTGKKAAKDTGPDIKEMVGSPRPVRNESPKPGTSQENVQRRGSSEETENQPPQRRASRQQSSGDESANRSNAREKPSMVDHVAKHIESLFSLMSKKDGDS